MFSEAPLASAESGCENTGTYGPKLASAPWFAVADALQLGEAFQQDDTWLLLVVCERVGQQRREVEQALFCEQSLHLHRELVTHSSTRR